METTAGPYFLPGPPEDPRGLTLRLRACEPRGGSTLQQDMGLGGPGAAGARARDTTIALLAR